MDQPARPSPSPTTADSGAASLRPHRRTAASAATVLGLAGSVVLATSGSPVWAVVRVVVVFAVVGAVVRAQRGGARLAGWSAVVVGALAAPAAGVMAPDHLMEGAVVRGVAAALAASAALVLLVSGTATLLHATRRWWRLLALPVAFVVLQLVMVPVGSAVLVTNRAPSPLGDATPADHGLEFEDVTLRTADGVDLAAWYVPSTNGAAVLLLHGSGSTRASTLEHAEVLAGLGYGVLMLDARGHGESAGTVMALGWYGNADVAPAVDWLLDRPDVEDGRIGAVGLSMGGEEALTAAAADPRILAVVGEGVGIRVAGDVEPSQAGGWLPRTVNSLTTAVTDLFTAADPPSSLTDVVQEMAPRPALLIAGRGEEAQAHGVRDAAPESVTVWELPDTAHTRGLTTHPQEWEQQVGEFLESALAG